MQAFKEQGNQILQNLQIILYQPQQVIEDTETITKIISENHDSAFDGHVGVNRLYRKLKTIYSYVVTCTTFRKVKKFYKT